MAGEALKLKDKDSISLLYKGMGLQQLGKVEEAEEAYKQAGEALEILGKIATKVSKKIDIKKKEQKGKGESDKSVTFDDGLELELDSEEPPEPPPTPKPADEDIELELDTDEPPTPQAADEDVELELDIDVPVVSQPQKVEPKEKKKPKAIAKKKGDIPYKMEVRERKKYKRPEKTEEGGDKEQTSKQTAQKKTDDIPYKLEGKKKAKSKSTKDVPYDLKSRKKGGTSKSKSKDDVGFQMQGSGKAVKKKDESFTMKSKIDIDKLRNYAVACLKKGKTKDAIRICMKIIKHDPKNSEVYNIMGVAYRKIDRIDQSIIAYKKAIAINPDSAKYCHNLAIAYHTMGDKVGYKKWKVRSERLKKEEEERNKAS